MITKKECRNISPDGYHYAGFWNELYHFTKNDHSKGYFTTSCNELDLSNGNLEYMTKNGYTRVENRLNHA